MCQLGFIPQIANADLDACWTSGNSQLLVWQYNNEKAPVLRCQAPLPMEGKAHGFLLPLKVSTDEPDMLRIRNTEQSWVSLIASYAVPLTAMGLRMHTYQLQIAR